MDNQEYPGTTVDGRNPAPVEVGSLFHYLLGFYTSQVVLAGFLPSTVGLNYCGVNPSPCAFSGDNFIEEIPAELGQFESQHGAKWCCVVQGSMNATHIGRVKESSKCMGFFLGDFPFKMHCLSWCHNAMTPREVFQ